MSHHCLSKKIWIVIIGITCTFFAMAYVWLYYVDLWSMRHELPVREMESEVPVEKAEEQAMTEAVNQASIVSVEKGKMERVYPCIIQMIKGEVGIYTEEGVYLRGLSQAGEFLGDIDRKHLQQGILIQNEQEMVMVLESYHLQ